MKSKTPNNKFGKELEKLRTILSEENGAVWTQKMVADAVGVTTQAYQNWIHGRRGKNIDIDTLKKLAEVLNADFESLVRLARPDILTYAKVMCRKRLEMEKTSKKIKKVVIYPPDVVYVANILKLLYINKREEFNKVKRIVIDFYPDIANKIRKSTKK